MENPIWIEDSDLTPVPTPTAASDRRPATALRDQGSQRQRVRHISVLLIEDNECDADVVEAHLKRVEGVQFTFERATHLSQAMRRLSTGFLDLALVDLGLPDSWGLDTIVQLQEHAPHVPMIVLTGTDDEELGLRAVRAGAQDYLVKGMSRAALVRSIRYALSRQRLRRKLDKALHVAQAGEANLRNVLASNVDGIVVLDESSRVAFANEAAETLLGRRLGELRGTLLDYPAVAFSTSEIDVSRPDGKRTPVEMRVVAVQWENQPARLAILRDLTAFKQAEETREKMRLAREVQRRILPAASPSLPGYDIAGWSWSAEATGGDYFDYVAMPDGHWGMVIGDASGHGFGPALLITETSAFTRAFATVEQNLGLILTLLSRQLEHSFPEDYFVTMILARLDPRRRALVYANAGHPDGYILDTAGSVRARLESLGPPLGVSWESDPCHSAEFLLAPGETVLLLSDGLLDVRGADGTAFGTKRALEVVRTNRDRPAQEIVNALCRAAIQYNPPWRPADDLTAVVVKVLS